MKSVEVVEFNIKESEYRMLARKFMSVMSTRGYQDVLLEKSVVPPLEKVLDENSPNNKAKSKGKNRMTKFTMI